MLKKSCFLNGFSFRFSLVFLSIFKTELLLYVIFLRFFFLACRLVLRVCFGMVW